MTSKAKKILVIVAVVLLCVIGLAACTPNFKGVTGGEPNADTVSNNGFVVKQGAYYYFINGYNTYESITDGKANKYGTPLKGSIMRTTKVDGKYSDPQVVVPKIVVSSNKEQGFSIFGKFIYYVTPSNAMNKDGTMRTTFTEFCRSDINGTKNEVIATFEGQDLKYKFTDRGLIVIDKENKLNVVPYDNDSIGTEKVVEKTTTSIMVSVSDSYKLGVKSAQDYVFYTKDTDDVYNKYNELYAVDGQGNTVKLIDSATYGTDKVKVTLKNVAVEANGNVVIYYEKALSKGSITESLGLYGYNFGTGDITAESKINVANEKRFTNVAGMTYSLFTFAEGVLVVDSNIEKMYIPSVDANGLQTIGKFWKLPKGFSPTVLKISIEKNADNIDVMYMYLQGSGRIERIDLSISGGDTNNTGFTSESYAVIAKDYSSTWFAPEFIEGEIFYMHTTYLSYMHVATISNDKLAEGKGLDAVMLGKFTDADKKAYDKIIADEKKADEDANN